MDSEDTIYPDSATDWNLVPKPSVYPFRDMTPMQRWWKEEYSRNPKPFQKSKKRRQIARKSRKINSRK